MGFIPRILFQTGKHLNPVQYDPAIFECVNGHLCLCFEPYRLHSKEAARRAYYLYQKREGSIAHNKPAPLAEQDRYEQDKLILGLGGEVAYAWHQGSCGGPPKASERTVIRCCFQPFAKRRRDLDRDGKEIGRELLQQAQALYLIGGYEVADRHVFEQSGIYKTFPVEWINRRAPAPRKDKKP